MRNGWCLFLLCFPALLLAQPSIVLQGVEGPLKSNILSNLTLNALKSDDPLSERQIESLANKGKKEILSALEPYGYYSPVIQAQWQEKHQHKWQVTFAITLGPQTHITEVHFSLSGAGENDETLIHALQAYTPQTGTPMLSARYEQAKKQMVTQAAQLGYLDAQWVTHEVDVYPNTHTAKVILHLETGPQYSFGETVFSSTPLADGFLQRYLTFSPGDRYSSEAVLHLQSTLRGTHYFQSVNVQASHDLGTEQIPVHVELTPNPRHHFLLGVGYTTDTGARGRAGWENRYINRFGHELSVQTNLAEKRQQWNVDYEVPGSRPWADRHTIVVNQIREEIDHRLSNSRSISLNTLSQLEHWQRVFQLQYLVASSRQFSGDNSTRDHFVLPSINFIRLESDDAINPHRGYRFSIAFRGSIDALLSSETFFQVHSQIKGLFPLFTENGHLILRTELGATTPDVGELPVMLRFFAGGDNSIRGYSYHSLGPTERDSRGRDAVVGGRHLFIASAEYDYMLFDKAGFALFIDTGNAMNNFNDPLKTGVGFGVRWKTPVGPVRADLAHPLHHHDKHRQWRLHLTFGPDL